MSVLAALPEPASFGAAEAPGAPEAPPQAPAAAGAPPPSVAAAEAAAEEGGSDSEADDGGFDYATLEEAQRIAAGGEGGSEAAGAAEGAAGEGVSQKKHKQRGGNKESQKRRKRQKREDDILRAKQAGLPVPSLRDALKASAPKASGSPSMLRGSVSYADAAEISANEPTASSSSSSAAPLPAGASAQAAAAALSPAAVARLARAATRTSRVAEALNARTVFVTNIPFKMTEQELREWLGASGTIREVRLARDKATSHVKGFAHVQFEQAAMAAAAVERCDRHEVQGRIVRVVPVGERCDFELPEDIKEDIRELLREAYEGKNLSTVKDAWQKRHPGQKLDARKWGFKNFSTAVATIEGVVASKQVGTDAGLVLERHLEKKLTNLPFFKDSPAHVAFLQERQRQESEKAKADSQAEGAEGTDAKGGAQKRPGEEAADEPEAKRRRGGHEDAKGTPIESGADTASAADAALARVAKRPCGCVIC